MRQKQTLKVSAFTTKTTEHIFIIILAEYIL